TDNLSVRNIDGLQRSRRSVEARQPPRASFTVRAHDSLAGLEPIARHSEGPLRASELGFHLAQRFDSAGGYAVDIPPARLIRDKMQNTGDRKSTRLNSSHQIIS